MCMRNVLCWLLWGLQFWALFIPFQTQAIDTVKVLRPQWAMAEFKDALIKRAMEVTIDEYGPYEFVVSPLKMNRSRSLKYIVKGDTHNLYITPSHPDWDKNTIAIKIPIRLGLLSYRLLLINKNDLELFSEIKTLEQLTALTAGLRSQWVTTKMFKHYGFSLVETDDYSRLFLLLDKHKYNYFPRSVYEVYGELADRTQLYKNLVIEPNLALNIPTATYVYISPQYPRLAERLTKGLTLLFTNGELASLVDKYYGDAIKKSQLSKRKIITIENPFNSEAERLNNEKYFYKP